MRPSLTRAIAEHAAPRRPARTSRFVARRTSQPDAAPARRATSSPSMSATIATVSECIVVTWATARARRRVSSRRSSDRCDSSARAAHRLQHSERAEQERPRRIDRPRTSCSEPPRSPRVDSSTGEASAYEDMMSAIVGFSAPDPRRPTCRLSSAHSLEAARLSLTRGRANRGPRPHALVTRSDPRGPRAHEGSCVCRSSSSKSAPSGSVESRATDPDVDPAEPCARALDP